MSPTRASTSGEYLVLLHAPVGRDARLLHELLAHAKIESLVCNSIEMLCREIEHGAGAVFVTEEALDPHALEDLSEVLRAQPAWSDLPLIVLTLGGEPTLATRERLAELARLGDLSLLERPLRSDTIVSVARTALRARLKQYEIRGREAELQLVADNVPVLISYIDAAQIYRRVNKTYFDWFGKTPEQVVGHSIRELVGEPHHSIAAPHIARALAGEAVTFESRVRDKTNSLREVLVSYAPDFAPDGTVHGFISLVQDITERKRAGQRHTLLLQLSDQQRNASDSGEVMRFAAEALGSHLEADHAGFFEVQGGRTVFSAGWTAAGVPLPDRDWPDEAAVASYVERLRTGEPADSTQLPGSALPADTRFPVMRGHGVIAAPIVRGGEPRAGLFIQAAEARVWRPDETELVKDVAEQTWDAVERARAFSALRVNEARFRFLAQLDDATRLLTDAKEITLTAAQLLSEHLDVNRCAYADVEEDENTFNLTGDYNRGVPSIVGRYTFSQFGADCLRLMRQGRPYVVSDSELDPRTEAVRDSYRKTFIRSVICVSLRKGARFVAAMAVHQTTPRDWRADEVELVQQVANRCWESIERARVTRELKEREQRFRYLAESIPQMVWTAGPDGSIDYINGQGAAFFSAAPEEIIGSGWLDRVHPEDRQETAERWKRSLDTAQSYEMFLRFRRGSDGSWRWHLVRALPLCSSGGTVTQWFGTFTDIDDQKAVEAELTRMNRELEEFAYVSSHDLQEPLRMVNTYTQLLLRRLGPQASPEMEQFAGYIRSGVKRMEALLRDLLTYSRVEHQELTNAAGSADLDAALRQALADLDSTIQEANAEFTVEPLPRVAGDETQLSHVFLNLLSNALKYRKAMEPPCVRIGAQRSGDEWIISVADNGIGFDQQHNQRIFGLFKRLHRHEEYPGTGLGLAICKRIVERYGGRIWAESQSGVGSKFSFSLPAGRVDS